VLDVEGGATCSRAQLVVEQGEWATMSTLIDDDVLRTIAVVGTPEECGADRRSVRWHRAGQLLLPGYEIRLSTSPRSSTRCARAKPSASTFASVATIARPT
jgi:hypothetical protein